MQSRTLRQCVVNILSIVILAAIGATTAGAQQQAPPAPAEEILLPEELTRILKEEWQFLKEETDSFLKSVEAKAEFETKAEFADRVARMKQVYLSKVNSHIAEKKFDKRRFAILFKANLVSYNADSQRYSITSGSLVDAPYNTPTIRCSVPRNGYLGLADSIRSGYRTSVLYLKFRPSFLWRAGRDAAQKAKADEPNLYFNVSFVLDLSQAEMKNQANLKILPKEISLYNKLNQQKLWNGGSISIGPADWTSVPAKKKPAVKPKVPPDTTRTR